ncbi:hypothetical protein POJ06DRAFT_136323 [Lipomyces tetrasporus]|uniref:Uncharacterized protein n=1 Tax=Lipomyces tetrasporus TaxID=54092 RepID=A0AAD7VSY3_9ASCO|nr:uncharacterized protein POJ06DRAFT_136323 [Lipomyces tetrasporus]KAJ8099505.1 hypothetical protein POJ06DRAFT_136323 [Lipomyces tetrasporus]
MPSLWARYNTIPFKGRLWIGVSTMAVAYGGMQLTDHLYERQQQKELEHSTSAIAGAAGKAANTKLTHVSAGDQADSK